MPSLGQIAAATPVVDIRYTTSGEDTVAAAAQRVKGAYEGVVAATEKVERSSLTIERRLESLQRRYDGEYRAAKQLETVRRDLDLAMVKTGLSADRANQIYSLAETKLRGNTIANDNLTKSIALQRHEWVNLSRQLQDVGTMAAMGASPMQILTSQAAQVYDALASSRGGVRGAVTEIGQKLVGLATPGRVAFAGIAAGAGLAYIAMNRVTDEANEINRALKIGAGLRSGVTAGDIGSLASNAPGLSRSEGRGAALAYAGAGASRTNTATALGLTYGLAGAMYDGDISAAQKGLGDAMRGGTSSLIKYVDGIRPLSTATTDWLERIQATQGEQAANAELLRILNDGIKAAGIEVPLWRQALTKLGNVASDLADDLLKEGGKRIGTTVDEARRLSSGQRDLGANTAREAGSVWNFLSGLVPSWGTPQEDPRQRPPVDEQRYGRPLTPLRASGLDIRLPPAGLDVIASTIADVEAQMSRGAVGTQKLRGLNGVYNQDSESLRKLNDDLATYDRLLGDNNVTMQMTATEIEAARVGRERLAAAGKNFLTVEQQAQQSYELSRQSISAYTADQKLASIQAQRFAEVSRDKTRAHLAEAEAQRAVTQEMDRWRASADQGLRSAQDSLKTAGMLPFQRQMASLAIERDRNIEQFKNPGLYDSIYRTKVEATRKEMIDGSLLQSKLNVNEQIAGLRVLRDSIGATDQAAAEMAAKQDLLNAATRAGIPLTKGYVDELDGLAKKLGEVRVAQDEANRTRQNIAGGLDDLRGGTTGLLSGALTDIRNRRDPLQGIVNNLGRMSDQLTERLVFRPLVEGILGKFGSTQDGIFKGALGGLFGDPAKLTVPQPINTPMATITAGTVVLGGAGMGALGLGTNPITGQPLGGTTGSGILGFGLGGPQASGARGASAFSPVGSGIGAFGFGPGGIATGIGGDIQSRFLNAVQAGGITNPYALATIAAYGKHESGYSARNLSGSWSDPSTAGQPGISGGILSWRNERLSAMRSFTAGDSDPASAQARFFLQENPGLTRALQNAGSLEEANRLMARSWKFEGWNGGAEFGNRLGTSRSYLERIGGSTGTRSLYEQRTDAGTIDFDAASKSFAQSTSQASQSLTSLADATSQLPAGADAATSSLSGLVNSLFSTKGGGGGLFAGLFGGGGPGAGETMTLAGGGPVFGPGTSTSDSIPARLSTGEYVVNAAATARHRGMLDHINFGAGYAEGGPVAPSRVPVSMRSASSTPAASAPASPAAQPLAFTIDVTGATGNQEVQAMVKAGMAEAIKEAAKQTQRNIGPMMADWQRRHG